MISDPETALFALDGAKSGENGQIGPERRGQRARCVTCDRSGPRGATGWQCTRCTAGNVSTYWKNTKRCETCNNPAAAHLQQCAKCVRDGVPAKTEGS